MSDRIIIKDLRLETRIGVSDEERAETRLLLFTIEIETDTSGAGVSDDLADSVSYSAAAKKVATVVGRSPARLLEHLAERAAATVLEMPGVESVSVEVVKPNPPASVDMAAAAVRITRGRE